MISITIIVMVYRIGNKKRKIMWPIYFLRYSLPILSFGFYGQIFLMFTTIFYCRKSESSTSPYLKCRPGHWFNNIKPIAGIAMFLNFLVAFLTNALYYKPIFLRKGSDLLKKSNSFPDIIFLFVKMITITIFILDKGVESEHWAILSFLVIITGINAYFTVFYKNRQNLALLTLNIFFSLLLFMGFLILFTAKILKFLNFDGSIFLFFACDVLILIYIFLYKNNNSSISKDYKNIHNPDEYLQYVSNFYNIIINKNNSREYLNNLQIAILSIEENCVIENCPLQKYLINLEKGFNCEFLLLEFCEKLFQYGISKFNGNIYLKNHYSIFLINEMNNKKKALINLESINYNVVSFQTNYNIYRCRKIIENYSSPFINKNNSILNHRDDSKQIKTYIKNYSFLYCQFLSLLLESNMQTINMNNLNKINELGHQIIKLNKKIDILFNNIINTKTDNYEIIKLYSEFVENILKDEEKNNKCKKLKQLFHNTDFDDIQENDYSNFNFEFLKRNSSFEFLIISSKNKNLGNIIDCSLNLCKILGYTNKELIGKHINILIPEIFHRKHNALIAQNVEKNKLNFLEGLYQNSIYFPNFIQKEIYCITKTKFLIPLNIKVYLVNSEENELVYIAEITNNISINKDLLSKNSINPSKYCILTDNNFLIQSFTPNCLNFLNINYEDISCNCNIINYINQFREDYISSFSDIKAIKNSKIKLTGQSISNNNTILDKNTSKKEISKMIKQKIKTDLFNKKYNKKCKITWNSSEKKSSNITKEVKEIIKYSSIILGNNINYLNSKLFEDSGIELYMEPKKIILDNELIGYFFFFSKIFNFQKNCYLKYKIMEIGNENSSINNSIVQLKKTKKYECTFKSNDTEKNMSKIINNLQKKKKRNSLEKLISKVKFKDEEKSSLISDYEQKDKKHSKYSSTHEMSEIKNDEDIIIDENFVPNTLINFAYDLKQNIFTLSQKSNNNKILNEALKLESSDIINLCTEINRKKNKNKKSDTSNNFESSNDDESDFESEEYSSSISKAKSNTKSYADETKKNSVISKNIENEKNEIKHNNSNHNYYKVNLTKIHFMIYDFHKDLIVENKEKNNISKIDKIIKDLSKEVNINLGKDETYPFISLKSKINIKEEIDKEKISNNFKQKEKENINIEEKLLKERIKDTINNNKDEISIINLKNLSLLSYILMCICGIINVYILLYYYSKFKEIFYLIKMSSTIKNCQIISIFYVKELALLSFNLTEIKGGEYVNFPAKNKNNYILLIKNKMNELFTESHNYISNVLYSSITFSKSTKKIYKNRVIETKLVPDYNIGELFNLIIQYNNEFYYFVLANNQIYHNDENVYNYIYDNFNKYRIALQLLIDLCSNEILEIKKNNIIINIIYLIIIFIIIVNIYIYISKYFILSNKKQLKYVKVLFGIQSYVLKNCLQDSLHLINNLKDSNENNNNAYEDDNDSIQNKLNLINKENNNLNGRNSMSNEIHNKEKNNIIQNKILFFILFGILLLLLYSFFIYGFIYLLNLTNKSNNMFLFAYYFDLYQSQIIDMFNIYREYLYDKDSRILNYTSFEYLRILEDEIYETITEGNKITDEYIGQLMASHPEIIPILLYNFCRHNVTDYFNYSFEECEIKFKSFIKRNFFFFSNYFLEEIKIGKNIVKHKNNYENIVGNLNNNNITNLIEEYQNEVQKNINTEFRLNLFNDGIIHSELNVIFINFLLPHLQNNRNAIFQFFGMDGYESFFYILGLVYFIILSIIFFASFLFITKILNVQINKAKNMLSIIPITVLTSQSYNNYINDLFVNK